MIPRIPDQRAVALREWARGDVALEAAVELLVRALGGQLLDVLWVRRVGQHWWFDPACAHAEQGGLSGGERRVLAVATSLASRDHPVDLGDATTGLGLEASVTVTAALAYAARLTPDEYFQAERRLGLDRLGYDEGGDG